MIELDGVRVMNTPDTIRWEPPVFLGHDGDGAPSYGPYWKCHLGFGRTTVIQLQHWNDAMDGETHTVRLPHPITGQHTEFTGVYVQLPEANFNSTDVNRISAAGVDFTITHLDVS